MRNFFHRIRIVWDDLDADDKLGFVMWAVVSLVFATLLVAAIQHLDDSNPKPLGKTIYLQPY